MSINNEYSQLSALIKSIRLPQIIKNLFLFTGVLFSRNLFSINALLSAFAGFCVFSLVCWAVYIFNDLIDRDNDRHHPIKSKRPIASGLLSTSFAITSMLFFASVSVYFSLYFSRKFMFYVALMYLINVLYSIILKNIVILDIMAIASLFTIRVLAGAAIVSVPVSNWLITCTIFLSLFLATCKRRAELQQVGPSSRIVLNKYDIVFLDQLISIYSGCAVLSYILYTVSAETVARFHSENLILSSPFVLYCVQRSLFLIHYKGKGEEPSVDLFRDSHIVIASLGWVISIVLVIYF